jgi:hypothetical protein
LNHTRGPSADSDLYSRQAVRRVKHFPAERYLGFDLAVYADLGVPFPFAPRHEIIKRQGGRKQTKYDYKVTRGKNFSLSQHDHRFRFAYAQNSLSDSFVPLPKTINF